MLKKCSLRGWTNEVPHPESRESCVELGPWGRGQDACVSPDHGEVLRANALALGL